MNNFDKLKERIEAYLANIPKDRTADVRSLLADILDYADDLMKNGNDGWISVDDELPSKDNFYLVYQFNGHKDEYETTIKWFSKKEQNFLEWDFQDEVTHWQYLPRPPKE